MIFLCFCFRNPIAAFERADTAILSEFDRQGFLLKLLSPFSYWWEKQYADLVGFHRELWGKTLSVKKFYPLVYLKRRVKMKNCFLVSLKKRNWVPFFEIRIIGYPLTIIPCYHFSTFSCAMKVQMVYEANFLPLYFLFGRTSSKVLNSAYSSSE